MKAIRAAVFDLGGTLLDFNPAGHPWLEWERIGLENACDFLAARYPLDRETFVAHVLDTLPHRWTLATQGHRPLTLGGLLQEACAAAGLDVPPPVIHEAVAHYVAPLDRQVVAYDDAASTLHALRERGLRIGLISNTMWPGDLHRQEMARLGILSYFDDTLFSADLGLWKPQPALYRLALERLGVPAEQAFFVGDTPEHDLVGAQTVGMKTVYKRNNAFKPNGIRPDAEISQLSELLDLLDHWEKNR